MMSSSFQSAKTEKKRGPSKEGHRMFREDPEALSEKVGLLRNHFYNHGFNDGTLLKVAEVQKITEELHKLVQLHNANRS
jgi:hypothetical protein